MELLYDERAKESGSYIIGACGFAFVASELGLVYAKQQFDGTYIYVCFYTGWSESRESDRVVGSNPATGFNISPRLEMMFYNKNSE